MIREVNEAADRMADSVSSCWGHAFQAEALAKECMAIATMLKETVEIYKEWRKALE